MRGLQTARVVVIDDDRDHAFPLLLALSRLGIAAMYFNGNKEQLPQAPLAGIRVVFLDLRLMGGPSVEARQYIPQTLAVLSKVIEARPGTTGIVCWTRYEDDIEELKKRLPQVMPDLQPSFLLSISNKDYFISNEGDTPATLLGEIDKVLKDLPGHHLIWEWEQAVHEAGSNTTTLLASMVANTKHGYDEQDENLLKLLASLAAAAGGKTISDDPSAMRCLFEGLNPIHFDQLEQYALAGGVFGPHAARLRKGVQKKASVQWIQAAKLNRLFLTADPLARPAVVQPGDVYIKAGWHENGEGFPFERHKKSVNAFIDELWSHPSAELLDNLINGCVPCFLEITPACDHATGKAKLARLLAGVLIRSSGKRNADKKKHLPPRSRMYAWQTEFIEVDNPELHLKGVYSLVVNARHLYSLPFEKVSPCRPAFRLRHQVVADIRAWFASHAARPGHISLR